MSALTVDTAALDGGAGQVRGLGEQVAASCEAAERGLRELAWAYDGAAFAGAAADVATTARAALDDLTTALLALADGLRTASVTYTGTERQATARFPALPAAVPAAAAAAPEVAR